MATDLPSGMDRREFSRASLLALLSGVVITISGCGGDDGGLTGPDSGGKTGTVSANHGHRAFISDAELTANNALRLNIQGTATHPHTVDLTTAEVQTIAAGTRLAKESSSDDGHTHTVTFN